LLDKDHKFEMFAGKAMLSVVSCSSRLLSSSVRDSSKLLAFGSLSSCNQRAASSDSHSNFKTSLNESTGIATLQLCKKPVNSLNLEFLTELYISLEKLENDSNCRALILTSGLPGIFSAGLDILEMYQPKEERLREFWRALQNFFMKLYGSRLTTIAAINGHSPAGGCLTAISCDYRIMAEGKLTIGLNETLLGIVAPFWFQDVFTSTIGHREAERGLQLGHLYSSQQALDVGLVDELVAADQLMSAAEKQAAKWMKIPDFARQLTKTQMRSPLIQKLQARQDQDIDNFVNFITKDAIQRAMGAYLESLKKK